MIRKFFLILIITALSGSLSNTHAQTPNQGSILNNKTALVIIDVQMFYFPGGGVPLFEPENASKNAGKLLQIFRNKGLTIIHVKHNSKNGAEIHPDVAPLENEEIITKDEANSFNGTKLLDVLKEKDIENLIICGMQTHMCVEATTRAAYDFGFKCTVVEDACATRDLKYGDIIIPAKDVHYSTLSTLSGYYAKIITIKEFLSLVDEED